jgi:putative transposase
MDNNSDTQYDFFYRRRLPHIQPPGASYFVTFRIAGSLPTSALDRIKVEKDEMERELEKIENEEEKKVKQIEIRNRYFELFDEYLDKIEKGPFWLKDDRIALIVSRALHYYDQDRYYLLSYTIMPNHVHVVFHVGRDSVSPARVGDSRYRVTDILQSIKKYTALRANKILNRSGQFWQHESYDHIVRGDKQLKRIIKYVLNNPVSAGFVDRPDQWKWSYCREDVRLD